VQVAEITDYALEHGKDATACVLRRYCNILERSAISEVVHSARENLQCVASGWPTDTHPYALIETAHDGVDWVCKVARDSSPEALWPLLG
jgi:hypothetical protein